MCPSSVYCPCFIRGQISRPSKYKDNLLMQRQYLFRRLTSILCLKVNLLAASGWLYAGPPVVETDPLAPEEQIAKFHLPPGFEIQLVASEPDIQKPMNLNFDSRGRLWVTHSVEYPWPAEGHPPRDGVTILDGIGPDGKATKISKFAEELNIPIGVLPLFDGKEAIVWSI